MPKSTFSQQYEEAMSRFRKPGTVATPEPETEVEEDLNPAPAASPLFLDDGHEDPQEWKKFSEVFGFPPPSGNDRRGPTFEATEFPDVLRPFIPKRKAGYFMPPEETEALWHQHIDGGVVWLYGQSGTGKSSLEQEFCAFIGQPFLRFNGRDDVESGALFGQLTVDGDGTVWKDGLLTEGVKYGARILMDEATVIGAGIMLGLQWLLERDGKLMLTDKPGDASERLVEPDPRFRLTFADNTRGQGDDDGRFNGTGVMNTATLNRVSLTLEIKYLRPEQELQVLRAGFGKQFSERVLKDIIELANLLRRAMGEHQVSLAFSLRSIESVLEKAYNYRTMGVAGIKRAFAEGYTNLLPNSDEQDAADNFYNMVFGTYN